MASTRGQNLIGKMLGFYVLERLLGYGGSSAVFLAHQHNSAQKVAVKVFLPRANIDKEVQRDFYRRFLLEAEAASQLEHPNILPIYSYGEEDGLPYIVMSYMQGGTLAERLAKDGPCTLREASWYLEQIASALDYAHEQGCVHCDVKPANILLDSDGRVFLSDFGIAHVMQREDLHSQTPLKANEALMGTPDYISPEQALGQPLDGRSDVYSLGITLFYLLARQLPFKGDTTIALALMHIHEPVPSLALRRIDVTPAIDNVVHKALAKNPDQRYQTATAFSAAFAQAIALAERATPKGEQSGYHSSQEKQGSNPQPIFLSSQPTLEVKPAKKRGTLLLRLTMGVCLLLVICGGIFATGFAFTRFGHTSTRATPTASTPKEELTPIDSLANSDNWPVSRTFFYEKNGYHIQNDSQDNVALALYANHQFSSFRLAVTMREIQSSHDGADYYGVVFRSTTDQSHYYLFEIVTSGTGQYVFWRYDGQWKRLADGMAPALLTSPNTNNTITIEARENTFSFTINNQPLSKTVTDSTQPALLSGAIGLYVEDGGAEVAFSNLYIEELKSGTLPR